MEQSDKNLLLKDLCARLPYGVKVETPYNKGYYNTANFIGVVYRASGIKGIKYIDIVTDKATYPIRYVKPYLRPISSMSEEEKADLESLQFYNEGNGHIVNITLDPDTLKDKILGIDEVNCFSVIDYLNTHHFDYRGLIEKDLAIAVTKENNPYKSKVMIATTLEQNYKYAIINNHNKVILFNESDIDFSPAFDEPLEDVSVSISDAGSLSITGNLITYNFYHRGKVWESEWEDEPHPKQIKEGKKHWWSKKTSRYVVGPWVRTTKTQPINYLMSNYKIEIYD